MSTFLCFVCEQRFPPSLLNAICCGKNICDGCVRERSQMIIVCPKCNVKHDPKRLLLLCSMMLAPQNIFQSQSQQNSAATIESKVDQPIRMTQSIQIQSSNQLQVSAESKAESTQQISQGINQQHLINHSKEADINTAQRFWSTHKVFPQKRPYSEMGFKSEKKTKKSHPTRYPKQSSNSDHNQPIIATNLQQYYQQTSSPSQQSLFLQPPSLNELRITQVGSSNVTQPFQLQVSPFQPHTIQEHFFKQNQHPNSQASQHQRQTSLFPQQFESYPFSLPFSSQKLQQQQHQRNLQQNPQSQQSASVVNTQNPQVLQSISQPSSIIPQPPHQILFPNQPREVLQKTSNCQQSIVSPLQKANNMSSFFINQPVRTNIQQQAAFNQHALPGRSSQIQVNSAPSSSDIGTFQQAGIRNRNSEQPIQPQYQYNNFSPNGQDSFFVNNTPDQCRNLLKLRNQQPFFFQDQLALQQHQQHIFPAQLNPYFSAIGPSNCSCLYCCPQASFIADSSQYDQGVLFLLEDTDSNAFNHVANSSGDPIFEATNLLQSQISRPQTPTKSFFELYHDSVSSNTTTARDENSRWQGNSSVINNLMRSTSTNSSLSQLNLNQNIEFQDICQRHEFNITSMQQLSTPDENKRRHSIQIEQQVIDFNRIDEQQKNIFASIRSNLRENTVATASEAITDSQLSEQQQLNQDDLTSLFVNISL